MEFLNKVVYSDEATAAFCGVLFTEYDSSRIYTRPSIRFQSLRELCDDTTSRRMGWNISPDGRISSDASTFENMSQNTMRELLRVNKGFPRPDLIDVMRFGAENSGFVVAQHGDDAEKRTLVPIRNYKCSNSSFNIYAPFKTEKGFRTSNLLNPLDGTMDKLLIAMDIEYIPQELAGLLVATEDTIPAGELSDKTLRIFECTEGLYSNNPFLGSTFNNYLAYEVASYTIGLKVVKALMPLDGATGTGAKTEPRREQQSTRTTAAAVNLKIEHEWQRCKVVEVINAMSRGDSPESIIARNPEAYPAIHWAATLMVVNPDDGLGSVFKERCLNLQSALNLNLFCCSLEQLSQRYILYHLGWVLDTSPAIFSGGGVRGNSRKTR